MADPLPTYYYPPLIVPDPDAVAAAIAGVLQEAWDRVEAEKERLLALVEGDARWPRIRDRLTAYQREIEAFQTVARAEAEHLVAVVTGQYANGMVVSAAVMGSTLTTWSQGHRAVVALLASDTYADFLARTEAAGRVSAAFARTIRRVAKEEMPFQATGGKTARDVGREMRRRLEDQYRIGTVTYANGSVHSIREYTEMAARTKGRVAYNHGSINGYHEAGVKYLEVFDGGSCGWETHRSFDKANGSIRTTESCAAQPISHPNCRRAFGPRPDIRTEADAAAGAPIQDLGPYVEEAHASALKDAYKRQQAALQ